MKLFIKACIVLAFASCISGTMYELVTYWHYPGQSACYTIQQVTGRTPSECVTGFDWPFWACLFLSFWFVGVATLAIIIDTARKNRAN